MKNPDVVLVTKKSQLALALEKKNEHIAKLLAKNDVSVRALKDAHDAHEACIESVSAVLAKTGVRSKTIYRANLTRAHCEAPLVITVGGDGTLLDASHKVTTSAVLGVNSATDHSVGFLCAAHRGNFEAVLDRVLGGDLEAMSVRRLAGSIDGNPLPFPVLNDVLMAHKNPAMTSRYLIEHGGRAEDHKSSGIWAATAAGSSAAMASAGGDILDLDDPRTQVRVREPFVADGPPLLLTHLHLDDDEVVVTSKMREARVYLDGPYAIYELPMGGRLTLSGNAAPLRLFATSEMHARRVQARQRQIRG